MLSRDPRDYKVIVQYSLFKEYEDGFDKPIITLSEEPNKTFWLVAKDGSFERRYSTESAPNWVLQIFNKILK